MMRGGQTQPNRRASCKMAQGIVRTEMNVNGLVELIVSGGTNVKRGTIRGLVAPIPAPTGCPVESRVAMLVH